MTTDTSFEFSAEPDEQAQRAAFRHFLRPTFALLRGVGLAIAVFGALLMVWGQYLAGFFALLLGLGFAFVAPPRTLQRVMRRATVMSGRTTFFRVDERGVAASNDLAEVLYRWPLLTKVDELPGMLVVAISETGFVSMRTGALDPETRAALTEFVRARVGRG